MCAGTHGTGLSHGNLASMITSLELISGNGEVLNHNLHGSHSKPKLYMVLELC